MDEIRDGITLSVIIPCYNSEAYMHRAIDSALAAGHDDVEIIIVNDGSRDGTAGIADSYEASSGGRVVVIHQENAGHGGAVNSGIRIARGRYVKVLDSDDWFDEEAYLTVLARLRDFSLSMAPVDLVVTNYVYEKKGALHRKSMNYRNVFPRERICTWEDSGSFRHGQYLMMHSLIYRRDVLIESGLSLPEHTFYVDNLFVIVPLPFVRSIFYMDENLYRYFIGRADQSVNEDVMIRRISQQLKVNLLMLDEMGRINLESPRLTRLLRHQFEIVTSISSILLIRSGDEASREKKDWLWNTIRERDPALHESLRRGLPGRLVNLSGAIGRFISLSFYGLLQRLFGFN